MTLTSLCFFKSFLAFEIFKIAKNQGVDEVILENKPIEKTLDLQSLQDLKEDAAPDNKFNVSFTPEEQNMIFGNLQEEEEEQEVPQEGFMSRPREVE